MSIWTTDNGRRTTDGEKAARRLSSVNRPVIMRRGRGFTLTELLISATVAAVVLVAILLPLSVIGRQWGAQASRSNAIETANLGMERMIREIRSAITYTASDGAGRAHIFTLPANIDSDGNYVPAWSGGTLAYQNGTQIRFYLSDSTGGINASGGILWREYKLAGGSWTADAAWSRSPGSTTRGRVQGVDSLTFSTSGLPSNTVSVQISVTAAEGSRNSTCVLQRKVYLSNWHAAADGAFDDAPRGIACGQAQPGT